MYVIFTDFCKAFELDDHHILLLCVLQETGFGEQLLSWYRYFIEGRNQFVKIHGVFSEILPISSGVLQGSGVCCQGGYRGHILLSPETKFSTQYIIMNCGLCKNILPTTVLTLKM